MALLTLTFRQEKVELPEPSARTCPARGYKIPEGLSGESLSLARLYADYGEVIEEQCRLNGLEAAAALAVMKVEAGGVGAFDQQSGLAVIRVEARPPILSQVRYPHGEDEFRDQYGRGQSAEWRALADWFSREGEKACYWTSFGLGQIMGFNHGLVNCAKPVEVMLRAQSSAAESAKMFFDFVKAQKIIPALGAKDWLAFAKVYNGAGNAQGYAERISGVYNEARSLGLG
ncbi:MAG: N-acetylmuramidase family protein [Candidatus Adiutrix sp.]|jgi:hypothetical protein|nr:N-acetylmuramidase family protein [Candidatus Adiutrix sp.]